MRLGRNGTLLEVLLWCAQMYQNSWVLVPQTQSSKGINMFSTWITRILSRQKLQYLSTPHFRLLGDGRVTRTVDATRLEYDKLLCSLDLAASCHHHGNIVVACFCQGFWVYWERKGGRGGGGTCGTRADFGLERARAGIVNAAATQGGF